MLKEALQEKFVGFILVGGAVVCVLSMIASYMFASAGIFHGTMTRTPGTDQITDPGDLNLVPISSFFFVIGVLMIIAGLGYGVWKTNNRFSGETVTMPEVKVLGRMGYSKDWSLVLAEWELQETHDAHYLVKIQMPTGEIADYECQPETYFACGEGMMGEAIVKGQWLGRFTPFIGMRISEA